MVALSHIAYDADSPDQNTTCIQHPARVEYLELTIRHANYLPDRAFLYPGLSHDSFLTPPGETSPSYLL